MSSISSGLVAPHQATTEFTEILGGAQSVMVAPCVSKVSVIANRQSHTAQSLQVFLCHSSEDKPAVRDLYERLRVDGFQPWLDEENIVPGQHWREEISKAVRGVDVVLVCLSRNALDRAGYVQKEIKLALDVADEQPEESIFVIPVRMEECPIPDRLNHLHWVNFFEELGYERLMRALQHRADQLNRVIALPPSGERLNRRLIALEERRDTILGKLASGENENNSVLRSEKHAIEQDITRTRDERDYLTDKQRFEQKRNDGKQLLLRVESLLLFKIPQLQSGESDNKYIMIDDMYRDAKKYIEDAIDQGFEHPRVYFRLAEIYDEFEKASLEALEYCCKSIELGPEFRDSRQLRIRLCILLKGKGTLYEEKIESFLAEDRKKLRELDIKVDDKGDI